MYIHKKKLSALLLGLLICTVISAGCTTFLGQPEYLTFIWDLEKNTKYVKSFKGRNFEVSRLVMNGESIDSWTEAIEIFNFWREDYPQTPAEMFKQLMEIRKKRCPDSIWNVINQGFNNILFETRTANCTLNPDGHSITMILYGNISIYQLIYTNKVKELPFGKREEIIKALSTAAIVTTHGVPLDARKEK